MRRTLRWVPPSRRWVLRLKSLGLGVDVLGMRRKIPALAPFSPPIAAPRPVPRPLPIADLPADDVFRLLEQVMAVSDRLPGAALSPTAQQALSGGLFAEAPLFVSQVGRVLAADPELFDDVQIDAADLVARQQRALAWECLQDGLLSLARQAGELFIRDQAAAIADARIVLAQVRGDDERPFPHPRHAERKRALSQAEQVLSQRQVCKERKAARRRALPPSLP